jgi:hypothetical protein
MIVANKKRIASTLNKRRSDVLLRAVGAWLLRMECAAVKENKRNQFWFKSKKIPILRIAMQKIAKISCHEQLDEPR